jgi:hypothetical protein
MNRVISDRHVEGNYAFCRKWLNIFRLIQANELEMNLGELPTLKNLTAHYSIRKNDFILLIISFFSMY